MQTEASIPVKLKSASVLQRHPGNPILSARDIPDVIFPGGMILEPSGEVKIYYGASDTVECLATAHVGDLLALCGQ